VKWIQTRKKGGPADDQELQIKNVCAPQTKQTRKKILARGRRKGRKIRCDTPAADRKTKEIRKTNWRKRDIGSDSEGLGRQNPREADERFGVIFLLSWRRKGPPGERGESVGGGPSVRGQGRNVKRKS